MDYWLECVDAALDAAGVPATSEQVAAIARDVENAHDLYGEVTGLSVASANLAAQQRREESHLQQRLRYEQEVPRVRCNSCKGFGFVRDGWGRDFGCNDCDGKGSTPLYPFQLRKA